VLKDFRNFLMKENFVALALAVVLGGAVGKVVQAVVDPNEPPLPGNINSKQALHFAEAIVRGEKHGLAIIKTILKDKVREVV